MVYLGHSETIIKKTPGSGAFLTLRSLLAPLKRPIISDPFVGPPHFNRRWAIKSRDVPRLRADKTDPLDYPRFDMCRFMSRDFGSNVYVYGEFMNEPKQIYQESQGFTTKVLCHEVRACPPNIVFKFTDA